MDQTSTSSLISPDWGADFDEPDPDADALEWIEEEGLVEDEANGWVYPEDASE